VDRSDFQFFFAWAAFVLLPFNLFAGGLLAPKLGLADFCIALVLGLGATIALGLPAVLIAHRSGTTFSQSARTIVRGRWILLALVLVVPLVNVGWYSIQTAAAAEALATFVGRAEARAPAAFAFAFLFAAGPLLFGYTWLSRTGALACGVVVLAFAWVFATTGMPEFPAEVRRPAQGTVLDGALLVLGTWVFSSTTCVMDLARFGRTSLGTAVGFALGLILADRGLIALGYAMASQDPERNMLAAFLTATSLPGLLFLLLALWSTNDSNVYSTLQAFAGLHLPAIPLTLFATSIAGLAAAVWGDELFGFVGGWLSAMGWLGIGFGGLWWCVLLRGYPNPAPKVNRRI
jgi:cytosine permease